MDISKYQKKTPEKVSRATGNINLIVDNTSEHEWMQDCYRIVRKMQKSLKSSGGSSKSINQDVLHIIYLELLEPCERNGDFD